MVKYSMNRHLFAPALCLLLGLILSLQALAKSFTATVDTNQISEFETLELTLRTDADTSAAPNLTPLENDFDVLGTRQSRQMRIINGQSESWRDWVVTLSPKKTGRLIIPSLTLNNMTSKAIRVEVQKDSNQGSGESVSPVFIRTEVNNETVYVQQEVVLTLKIFYRVQLNDDRRLTPLNIDGAIVQQLGETRNYETVLNGTRYGVFELNFAIHPQKAGAMTLPAMTFTSSIPDRRDPFGSIFSMGGGKPVTARSSEVVLNVKPQPNDYTGSVWLPARNLNISDTWSTEPDEIRVGDAFTRTIVIQADGLSSAQLPAIKIPRPDGVNVYPDQTKSDDTATSEGIIGRRVEAIAMVPTKAGSIRLPAIKYTWFDVVNNRERVAEIPAKTINVLPAEGDTGMVVTAPEPQVAQKTEQPEKECPVVEPTLTSSGSDDSTRLWQIIAGTLGLLWVITLIILINVMRRRSAPESNTKVQTKQTADEAEAFKQLSAACNSNDAETIRKAFIAWCQALFQDTRLSRTETCLKKVNSEELRTLFSQLDASQYGQEKGSVPSSKILEQCKALRKGLKVSGKAQSSELQGLYPGKQ